MNWKVGDKQPILRVWDDDGTPVTSGSASYTVETWSSGSREYLQGDGTTLGATIASFPLSQVGGEWQGVLTVPQALAGKSVIVTATHSDADLPPLAEEYDVTLRDDDDIYSALSSHSGDRPVAKHGGGS